MGATVKAPIITTNGTTILANSKDYQSLDAFSGTVSFVQTGTGTWKLVWSPDGINWIDMKDGSNNTITGTVTGGTNFFLGKGTQGAPIFLGVATSGMSGSIQPYVHVN